MTVSVSNHAAERYLERVKPSEPYPQQAILNDLDEGEKVTVDHIHGEAIRSAFADAWYVVRGDRVVTVLEEFDYRPVDDGGDDD